MMIFSLGRRPRLVAVVAGNARLIGRIHIGGRGGEFGGAGVDALEHRPHAELVAMRAHLVFARTDQFGQSTVGEAHGLECAGD